MDAKAKAVREILHSGDQFLVPFFQRSYSWHKKHWRRLWSDLHALLDDPNRKHHFLGPLVCASLKSEPGEIHQFQLIDGQQRLTTLSLLLAAVRDATNKLGNEVLAAEISETYLVNRFKKGTERYKVVPRLGDRNTFFALTDGKSVEADATRGLSEAYDYFTKSIQADGLVAVDKLRKLFDTIVGRLHLVVITLDEENPFEIFESLNSTGLPLQESDLIRNFLFMQLPIEQHEAFQVEHWQRFEELFDAEGEFPELTATPFYREFLMRNGSYSRKGATFVGFKAYFMENHTSVIDALNELTRFLSLALSLARRGKGFPAKIAKAIHQFELLDAATANPLLLNLVDRQQQGTLSEEELLRIVSDLTSFITRRSFCGESTRRYGKWFCEAISELGDSPRKNLQSYLAHRGWPDDETYIRSAIEFPAYRRELKKVRLILQAIEEDYGHKEKVDLAPLQIEHVMPQKLPSGAKGKAWREMLGEDWPKVHKRRLHVLGNLTLTGYNPNLSNKPFAEKREELIKSKLSLNDYFKTAREWNEVTIRARTEELAKTSAKLWARAEGIIDYKPAKLAREGVPRPGRERRHAYWSKLIELLESQQSPWLPLEPPTGAVLELDLPTHDANLSIRFQLGKKRFEIPLRFTRARGKRMFELLKKERHEIDVLFKQPPDWGTKSTPYISVRLDNSTIKDPLDWHDQHQWLAGRLAEFHSAFFERLAALDTEVLETDSRKRRLLEYWSRFHQLIKDRNSPLHPQRPLPQVWMVLTIGRSWFHMTAECNSQAKRLNVGLRINGPLAHEHYCRLTKHRRAIEDEFGGPLDWRADKTHKRRHIQIVQEGVDLLDKEKWPDQHEWLLATAEKLQTVLQPRIKALPARYDDDV